MPDGRELDVLYSKHALHSQLIDNIIVSVDMMQA